VRRGKGICNGDSGGPLITVTNTPKLIGISSFVGEKCADLKAPSVFARVSARYDTIVQTICENTPSSHPTASFCDGGGSNPTAQPPATSPVAPPTTGTGPSDCKNGGCPGGTGKLEVDMLTDEYGNDDNFWFVKKGRKKVLNVKNLNNATAYEWCSCLPAGKYNFFIKDREGDGFIEPGYLKMKFNGKLKLNLKESSGEWKKKKKNLKVKK